MQTSELYSGSLAGCNQEKEVARIKDTAMPQSGTLTSLPLSVTP